MATINDISTINSPEFINLQPLEINPLMSKCEIKVLYVGQNRNHSYISKEVAVEMSKTLRGAPIVGWYNEGKEDFMDHGERVTMDGEGIKFETLTIPYGFVAPNAEVWFQKFDELDDFGNVIQREYLMTTGYLWTGQFEEAKAALEDGGRPHSMELDSDTLQGKWAEDPNSHMDFFIINDAIFSKLCILGKDVEPCFEGSCITEPNISANFSLDMNFQNTLYSMMKDLKFALEGGQTVNEEVKETTNIENFTEENVENLDNSDEEVVEENKDSIEAVENEVSSVEEESSFVKKDDDKEEKEDTADSKEEEQDDENDDKEDKKKEKSYSLLKEQYDTLDSSFQELQNKYSLLEKECNELKNYKLENENKKKDDLISQFSMLSEEDKKDVIENKSKYTLDEIESKLSVICVRKKVKFTDENVENPVDVITYNFSNTVNEPAWITAIKKRREEN